MGYDIEQIDSNFMIKREHHADALEALRNLWLNPDEMSGASNSGVRWFAFCNGARPQEWTRLESALLDMRWRATVDGNGDVVAIKFMGQKRGDDDKILAAIAPYVESGSFIAMEGEDGFRWTWKFTGGTFFVTGRV